MQFSLKKNQGELESIHFNRELCRILICYSLADRDSTVIRQGDRRMQSVWKLH